MKKWFEWCFANQCKDRTKWDDYCSPVTNLRETLAWFFNQVKESHQAGESGSWHENVFYRLDWTERTAAGTNGDVHYRELWDWVHDPKYQLLMDRSGIEKINQFDDATRKKMIHVLAAGLNLKPETINFYVHNERPGEVFPMHFDRNKWNHFSLDGNTDYDPNYGLYIIFFDDWQHGHAFQMGTKFLTWKSGDVFSWSHRDTPHGSSNFGYEDRTVLLVNGVRNT